MKIALKYCTLFDSEKQANYVVFKEYDINEPQKSTGVKIYPFGYMVELAMDLLGSNFPAYIKPGRVNMPVEEIPYNFYIKTEQ